MSDIKLSVFQEKDAESYRSNTGEKKLVDEISFSNSNNWKDELSTSSAHFVLVGICEDIGVKAGRKGSLGSRRTYFECLDYLLRSETIAEVDYSSVFLLGHLEMKAHLIEADWLDSETEDGVKELGEIVKKIDCAVAELVELIVSFNKVPILIGGGQNSALGMLQGIGENEVTSICIDSRLDLNTSSVRNNENVYTNALNSKLVNKHFFIGVEPLLISKKDRIKLQEYQNVHVIVKEKIQELECLEKDLESKNSFFSLDIDLNCISGFPSTQPDLLGMSFDELRKVVKSIVSKVNISAYHVSEGNAKNSPKGYEKMVSSSIFYLLTDLILEFEPKSI